MSFGDGKVDVERARVDVLFGALVAVRLDVFPITFLKVCCFLVEQAAVNALEVVHEVGGRALRAGHSL